MPWFWEMNTSELDLRKIIKNLTNNYYQIRILMRELIGPRNAIKLIIGRPLPVFQLGCSYVPVICSKYYVNIWICVCVCMSLWLILCKFYGHTPEEVNYLQERYYLLLECPFLNKKTRVASHCNKCTYCVYELCQDYMMSDYLCIKYNLRWWHRVTRQPSQTGCE